MREAQAFFQSKLALPFLYPQAWATPPDRVTCAQAPPLIMYEGPYTIHRSCIRQLPV